MPSDSTSHTPRVAPDAEEAWSGYGTVPLLVLAACFLAVSFGAGLILAGRELTLDAVSLLSSGIGAAAALALAGFGFRMRGRQLVGLAAVALAVMLFHGGFAALLAVEFRLEAMHLPFVCLGALAMVAVVTIPLLRLPKDGARPEYATLRAWAWTLVFFSLALRMVFLAQIDLIPEEAYYWAYAQHPAMGYLDHPPMVAWLIGLGTGLFGDNEFGVRLPALICWAIATFFVFKLTFEAFGKPSAWWSLIFMSTLLGMTGVGSLMTPDAPLLAAWAGILYFGHRALTCEMKWAWIGVGACIGIGMLSKYTTSLAVLGLAALVIPQRRYWKQLLLPQLWLGAILSVLIFAPVIRWNWEHEWASFAFQSIRRMEERPRFNLHALVLNATVLVGPIMLIGLSVLLISRRFAELKEVSRPTLWFLRLMVALPLAVFLVSSFSHSSKLNWTNPIWLGGIPVMSLAMLNLPRFGRRFGATMRWGWRMMIPLALLVLGVGFHYLALGLPLVPNGTRMKLPVAWRELGRAVEEVETRIEIEFGRHPMVVGMDTYFLASEIGFYAHKGFEKKPEITSSRNMFGSNGLMYGAWTNEAAERGGLVLMIALKEKDLQDDRIAECFDSVTPIVTYDVYKNRKLSGRFYYAVGTNYRQRADDPFGPLLTTSRQP